MTFRSRIALTLGLGAMLPLLLLAYGVRREMTRRLATQADERVGLQVARARELIETESRAIDGRLARLARSLGDNNQFRLAVVSGETAVPWLRDWAHEAMLQSDLDLLELVDSAGQILSSGHFRNEFGRRHPGLSQGIERGAEGPAVFRGRTPSGEFDALVRSRSLEIAGRRLALIGGTELDLARLVPASDPELKAAFVIGVPAPSDDQARLAEIPLTFLTVGDTVTVTRASIVLTRELGPMLAIRRSVDRWFLGASVVVLLLTTGIALWLSSRVTRPLADLAEKTARLDLDRLDQTFATGRPDEIGALAQLLDAMTERLRASAIRLREAERRAVTGDLARQINHDVKNGLAPIRHVLRHLGQVAADTPGDLPAIFRERQGTLESSVAYLENLSRNYARLSPALDRAESDLNAVLQEIARTVAGPVPMDLRLAESLPSVRADTVALRRILENLGGNAVDAAREVGGRVTLTSEFTRHGGAGWVRLVVADTGKGMSQEQLDRAFDDFYTTKEGGTGLGLSVVRRLVADLGGVLRVETAPGQGSRFIVELPAGGA
jgi:signal transduction histidine kinase